MAPSPDTDLGTFEDHAVLSHAIELPSLAGGLREAAEVSGSKPIRRDDEGYLLIKFKGNKTRFDPVKNTDGFQRVDIPSVEGLAFVSGKAFEKAISDQAAAIEAHRLEQQKEKEAQAGTQRVPGTEPWPTDADGEGEGGEGMPDGPGEIEEP